MGELFTAVIVALITGGLSLIGVIYASKRQSDITLAKLEEQSKLADAKIHGEMDVIKTEITQLRKETEKHNSIVERTYSLEQRVSVHDEKISVANHRISDLEKEQRKEGGT